MRTFYIIAFVSALFSSTSQNVLKWSASYNSDWQTSSVGPRFEEDSTQIKISGITNPAGSQGVSLVRYHVATGAQLSSVSVGADSVNNQTVGDYFVDKSQRIFIAQNEKIANNGHHFVKLQKYDKTGLLIAYHFVAGTIDTSFIIHSITCVNDTCFFVNATKEWNLPPPGSDINNRKISAVSFLYNTDLKLLWRCNYNENTQTNHFYFGKPVVYNDRMYFGGSSQLSSRVLLSVGINKTVNSFTTSVPLFQLILSNDNKLLVTNVFEYSLTKIDLSGNVIWRDTLGTNLPFNVSADRITDLTEDQNGNIFVTGTHQAPNYGSTSSTGMDIVTCKYNSNGVRLWAHRTALPAERFEYPNKIILKGNYVYTGGYAELSALPYRYGYIVTKLAADFGTPQGIYRYSGTAAQVDQVSDLKILNTGEILLTGTSTDNVKNWTTQLLSDVPSAFHEEFSGSSIHVFPNPVRSGTNLQILTGFNVEAWSLSDIQGRVVTYSKKPAGTEINCSGLRPGNYILTVKTSAGSIQKKIIVE